ncbi:restriction endonuclease subunit S [Tepidibacter mesophilus]|uniref:restriction endonuclease subunit S n=1 Tax=Tepidibacter mesophilus TaxID=655607 RepID=UPI000C06E83D|nr:restriction endonuclease subunit S [Tepidibacter mesophilus]
MSKTPKLRFPEFSGDWEEKKLGEVSEIIGGGTPSTTESEYWNGKIQWFTPTEIKEQKFVSISERTITNEGLKKSSAKILPKGTVLLTTRASLGDMAIANNEVTTNQGFQSIVAGKNINNEFIYYLQPKLKKYCYKNASGSTFLEISKKAIEKFKFYMPFKNEQKKIATFCSLIDKKIEKQQEKIKALQDYKKGMMQKIFSQEIRFKKENGEAYPEWEIKKLGSISSIGTGSNDLQDKKDNGKYPFFVRSKNIERIDKYTFDGEAILIPGDGNVGRIYHYINGKFAYHQRVYKISDFNNNMDGKYIYYFMKQFFLKEALKNSVKATVDSLRLPTLTNMEIQTPTMEEQEKIANCISKLDQKIEKEQEKLDLLKQYKKGVLQQMFV